MTEQTIPYHFTKGLPADLSDKQKQILIAALELFTSQGFEATTTQQIADRAGVASGSVYKKFPNKEALLEAVLTPLFQTIHVVADEFVVDTFQKLPAPPTLEVFVGMIIRDRMTFARDNAEVLKLMIGQLLVDQELAEKVKLTFMEDLAKYVYPVFTQFKASGEMVDLPNDTIFQLLLSTVVGYLGRLILDPNSPDLETEIRVCTDFLVKGLSL